MDYLRFRFVADVVEGRWELSGKNFGFSHFALGLAHLILLILGAKLNHGWYESLRDLVVVLHVVLELP